MLVHGRVFGSHNLGRGCHKMCELWYYSDCWLNCWRFITSLWSSSKYVVQQLAVECSLPYIKRQCASFFNGSTVGYWVCHSYQSIYKSIGIYQTICRRDLCVLLLFLFSFNSLWPSDTIWRHESGSTLAQVMACCLTAPSHYLNQSWLIISKVQWQSSESNFTRYTSAISHWN